MQGCGHDGAGGHEVLNHHNLPPSPSPQLRSLSYVGSVLTMAVVTVYECVYVY